MALGPASALPPFLVGGADPRAMGTMRGGLEPAPARSDMAALGLALVLVPWVQGTRGPTGAACAFTPGITG